jgi:signal transduction histidine kinase
MNDTPSGPIWRAEGIAAQVTTLEEVDIRGELDARPCRVPDYEAEDRAFATLAREMSEKPGNMLQKLAEVAVDLCGCGTAGISVLDGDVFRWEAVAGVFARARGGTMPRNQSPCGVCTDSGSMQLMYLADRLFPALLAEPRFVESLLVPFHHHGQPIGTVWIVSHSFDKRFDKEDERNVRVLARFASAAWDLWKACEATLDTNRRKDGFLAMLGHELRNPLAAATAAAAILRQRLKDDDDGAIRATDVIARQCHRMSRLVEDLLDVARIGYGKMQLEQRRLDLRPIITEAIDERRVQIERRGQNVTIELGASPVWVNADPVRLSQVMSNLIDNAAKYTPESGHIFVEVTVEDCEVHVDVHDSGIGVAADQMVNLFKPFSQLTESRNASAGGLGIGLALVKNLIELHGGTVHAMSPGSGQGSCFTIRLPLPSQRDPKRSTQFESSAREAFSERRSGQLQPVG